MSCKEEDFEIFVTSLEDVKVEIIDSEEIKEDLELDSESFTEVLRAANLEPTVNNQNDPAHLSDKKTSKKPRRKYKPRVKRPPVIYLCDICGHQTKSEGSMEEHRRIHSDKKPYICKMCDFRCSNRHEIMKHAAGHVTAGEKRYECSTCPFECSTYQELLEHSREHAGDKPYRCSECSYATANMCAMKKHQMGHTGEKPQKCPFCSYRCLALSCLKEHIATHTGVKHLQCSFCDYRTSSRSTIMRHIRRHTGEKPNKCPQCDYRSIQRITLQRHIKRKHTAQLFTLNND